MSVHRRTEFVDLRGELDGTRSRVWFAEGAIEADPLVVIIGPEKSGKSWINADLAASTVLGQSFLGRFPIATPGPVVLFDAEYGPRESARRLARIARHRGSDPSVVLGGILYRYTAGESLALESELIESLLHDVTHGLVKPRLIIVDPLRNHLGDGDENSARDMLVPFTGLSALRDEAECPVVVAHHLNRAGNYAGSRALLARADLILEASDEADPWYSARGRTLRRGDLIAQGFAVSISHEHDDDDAIATTALVARFAGERGRPKAAMSALARRVLAELRDASTPLTKWQLRKRTKANSKTVDNALRELTNAGHATARGEGWEAVEIEAPTGLVRPVKLAPVMTGLVDRPRALTGPSPKQRKTSLNGTGQKHRTPDTGHTGHPPIRGDQDADRDDRPAAEVVAR